MENEEVLNQFGKMYIESVRDNSLHTLDNILNGGKSFINKKIE